MDASKKTINTISGEKIEVDTSPAAFKSLGFGDFYSGQKVFNLHGEECILEGVGYEEMWYTLTKEFNGSCYSFRSEAKNFIPPKKSSQKAEKRSSWILRQKLLTLLDLRNSMLDKK